MAAVALLAAAAGGFVFLTGGDKVSKQDFTAKAEDVCRPANGPITAIVQPTSYGELKTAATTMASATSAQVGQLRALDLPGGDDGTAAKSVIANMEALGQSSQKLADAASRSSEGDTISAAKDFQEQSGDATGAARAFGFSACAVGMQPGIDHVFGGAKAVVKTNFVAKADGVCRALSTKLFDVEEPDWEDPDQVASFIDETIAITEQSLRDLRAIPVPPGDEQVVEEMLSAQDKVISKDKELLAAAQAEDPERFGALLREESPLITAADAKLDAYGLGSCGSNFGEE